MTLSSPFVPERRLQVRALALVGLVSLAAVPACSRNLEPPAAATQNHAQTRPASVPPATGRQHSAAGIRWRAPASWSIEPDRPMRVVTYRIPASGPDPEGAECSVFFFGEGQGGDVEANIARWRGQFEPENGRTTERPPQQEVRVIQGFEVTLIDIEGTYLFSPTPMSPQKIRKPGYRMLGAIVAAPAGNVFFKLTGPAATVAAAEQGFQALVQSLESE